MTAHERLVEHLTAGTLDGEDRAHAAGCPACAALLGAEAPEAPHVRAEWLEAAHRELARPVRPWWVLALWLGLANALLAAAAVAVLQPWHWEASASHPLLLASTALLSGMTTLGVLLALSPRRQWLRWVLALAALAPVAVLVTAGHGVATHPFLAGVHCVWTAVSMSALPLAGGVWLLTKVAYSPLRALAVGLVSAGVGLLVLELHCDGTSLHVLAFHLLPWAALAVAAVLVRRALPSSSYAP